MFFASHRIGMRTVHGKTSGDRKTVTVIVTANAEGRVLSPHFIIPGKTIASLNSFRLGDAPADATFSVSESGWINEVRQWRFSKCNP